MVELKDFLHPGEKKLLQRILNIAVDNYNIQEFIKNVNDKNRNSHDFIVINEGKVVNFLISGYFGC